MSKSGLFAHFGSKEELQLATIETAGEVFAEEVVDPGADAPRPASSGSRQLAENFLRHVEDDVFPGGCFFASVAAELDTRPGVGARPRLPGRSANGSGRSRPPCGTPRPRARSTASEDPEQLVFELDAFLLLANAQFVISRQSQTMNRARHAIERRLAAAAPAA